MKLAIAALFAATFALAIPATPGFAAQTIGSSSTPGEDSTYSSGCFGDCGKGCAWWRCGHTGACENHDYYTRKYGMWSRAALNRLGPALVDWGACWYGKGKQWVSSTIRSGWTGATDGSNRRMK